MTTVGVAELKAALSGFLARVRAGEIVVVTDHGRPVARIVPLAPPGLDPSQHLAGLARAGLVRVGRRSVPAEYWRLKLPADPTGASLAVATVTESAIN